MHATVLRQPYHNSNLCEMRNSAMTTLIVFQTEQGEQINGFLSALLAYTFLSLGSIHCTWYFQVWDHVTFSTSSHNVLVNAQCTERLSIFLESFWKDNHRHIHNLLTPIVTSNNCIVVSKKQVWEIISVKAFTIMYSECINVQYSVNRPMNEDCSESSVHSHCHVWWMLSAMALSCVVQNARSCTSINVFRKGLHNFGPVGTRTTGKFMARPCHVHRKPYIPLCGAVYWLTLFHSLASFTHQASSSAAVSLKF